MTERQIEVAERRRQEAEAKLHRPDGSKYYGDEEHRERLAAIKREHRAAFDAIDADIAERMGRAERELLALEHADPTDALTIEELQRANAKSAFVADDVERLSTADLAKRCRAALASGDRSTVFLLAHHAGLRADRDQDLELAEAAAELRAKLDPDRKRKLEEARGAVEEAEGLKFSAQLARRGARDAGELHARASYWTSRP